MLMINKDRKTKTKKKKHAAEKKIVDIPVVDVNVTETMNDPDDDADSITSLSPFSLHHPLVHLQ